MDNWLTLLPSIGRYRFHILATTNLNLPCYTGSTWRGVLGHGLKKTVCIKQTPDCKSCALALNCIYTHVFETSSTVNYKGDRRTSAIPNPYVLDLGLTSKSDYQAGQSLVFGITLFGKANQYLPYIAHSLEQAGVKGIGKRQGQFIISQIDQEKSLGTNQWQPIFDRIDKQLHQLPIDPPMIPEALKTVRMTFKTPLRMKCKGKLLRNDDLDACEIMKQLFYRLQALAEHHGKPSLSLHDDIWHHARQFQFQSQNLTWYDWTRYSSRQKTRMKLGGLLGSVELTDPQMLWPYLWLGQWLHLGKATSFGLGRYRLSSTQEK